MKRISLVLITALAIFSQSCKEEGCTDPDANNYNQDATDDDGSCEYTNNTPPQLTNLAGTISTPETIVNVFSDTTVYDYYLDGNLNINAAVTIEPGVRILMKENAKINISSSGSMNATGTSDNRIVFIADEDLQGFWQSIDFNGSNSANNKMIYTEVKGGGKSTNIAYGAINLINNSRLVMQDSKVIKSGQNGLATPLNNTVNATLPDFERNYFSQCNQNPIRLHFLDHAQFMDETTVFDTDNTYNRIYVHGGNALENPMEINKVNGFYYLHNLNNVLTDLVINEGVKMWMGPGAGLNAGNLASTGTLKLAGTSNEPILLTGYEEVPGYWNGLRYRGSNSNNNLIEYATIAYAGAGSDEAALSIGMINSMSSSVSMGNSSINFSAGYGVDVTESGSTFNDLGGNTFQGNADLDINN